jgi:hypothetical protein
MQRVVHFVMAAALFLGWPGTVWHGCCTDEGRALPEPAFSTTPEVSGLDNSAPPAFLDYPKILAGPITPVTRQPSGPLSGRIIFTSAGHGWAWGGNSWGLGRPLANAMNEDYGNLDQMTLFVFYCFNAGGTVVPLRPVGHQTNEVVLDNTDVRVSWAGAWTSSTSSVYYGVGGTVPYRYASISAIETATATYTPLIPVSGLYPVYAWALSAANRTNQLYRINHTGGQSLVRVPHHMVGNGWVYLGSYWFDAGVDAARGSVVISNLGEGTPGNSVVVADAVRFGNGMGDVDRGGGVSGYPREEECSRYWVQRSLGQGQSATIYDSAGLNDYDDNVRAPTKLAVEMNREAAGSMYKRVFVSFHSNAGGGRGVVGLYNNPALSTNVAPNSDTPNQYRLAGLLGTAVNNELSALRVPPLEVAWHNRGANVTFARSDYAFGEINNNTIGDEFDATIVEVAFHDDLSDAKLMRDPKVRNWVARACYHGILRYFNQFDAAPMVVLPEPPVNPRAQAVSSGVLVSWSTPSGAPTGYVVFRSSDGRGFGQPVTVAAGTLSLLVTNVTPGEALYFRVGAINAGGESMSSEVVGCRVPANPLSSRILIVNGFTRFDRTLNLRQTPKSQDYRPPGHDQNSGTMERVLAGRVNAFDYVVPHGKAIRDAGSMGFDSCQVDAITNGTVSLPAYDIVMWACGNQSTAERTFNPIAQEKIRTFLASNGRLFVSGAEIAWDLDRVTGPSAADRTFLHEQLHVALNGDINDDSSIYSTTPLMGSIFSSAGSAQFDDGSRGIYCVGFPDAVTPRGPGAAIGLSYPGYTGGSAAVTYNGSAGGGRVVYFGFPFETLTTAATRAGYMAAALRFLSRSPLLSVEPTSTAGELRLRLTGEPGRVYTLESSTDLTNWDTFTNAAAPAGTFETRVPPGSPRAFYRALLPF